MCYSTTVNTLGMGNVVPPSNAALTGAEQSNNANLGSGDKASSILKGSKKKNNKPSIAVKKPAPHYGAELPYIVYAKNKK